MIKFRVKINSHRVYNIHIIYIRVNKFVIQISRNKKYKIITNIRLFNLLRRDIYLIIRNIFFIKLDNTIEMIPFHVVAAVIVILYCAVIILRLTLLPRGNDATK